MADRTGALRLGRPGRGAARGRALSPSWGKALLKALMPWAVVIVIWESRRPPAGAARCCSRRHPSFLSYAIESDFRVGFGGDAMPIPVAIVVSALRVLAGLAIGFAAAIVTGILISASAPFSDMVMPMCAGSRRSRRSPGSRSASCCSASAIRPRSSWCSWASISS